MEPVENDENPFPINEKEVMEYYGCSGKFDRFKLKVKFFRSWILHSLAYSSPLSSVIIKMQRARGVKIGKNCFFNSYIFIDLIYPQLITIEDNVSIGSNVIIYAHANISANLFLKKKYPRKVAGVKIKSGAAINPGVVIMAGITIGKNSIISPRSVVTQDIPDHCIAVGNPARVIKKIDF